MSTLEQIKGLLAQYAKGTPASDQTHTHFDQVAREIDHSTLADGVAAALRSNETPAFAQMVAQLFAQGSAEQKAGMLNELMASASPGLRAQLANLIPELRAGGAVTHQQGATVAPDVVRSVAEQVEQHDPSVVDTLSGFYARHPTLVKTLGTTAMIVALRKIAEKYAR